MTPKEIREHLKSLENNGNGKGNGNGKPQDAVLREDETVKRKTNEYVDTVDMIKDVFFIFYDEDTNNIFFLNKEEDEIFEVYDVIAYFKIHDNLALTPTELKNIAITRLHRDKLTTDIREKYKRYKYENTDLIRHFETLKDRFTPTTESEIEKMMRFIDVENLPTKRFKNPKKRFVYYTKKWLCATIMQAYHQYKNDICYTLLSGAQGTHKSSFIDFLSMSYDYTHVNKNYHLMMEYTNALEKRHFGNERSNITELNQLMRDSLFLKIEEMEAFTPKTQLRLRATLDINKVKIRNKLHDRIASFAGSANLNTFNLDREERRLAINQIIYIRTELFAEINIDLIYAECIYEMSKGFDHRWTQDDIDDINEYNNYFTKLTKEDQYLITNFLPHKNKKDLQHKVNVFTTSDILEIIINDPEAPDELKESKENKLGQRLKKLFPNEFGKGIRIKIDGKSKLISSYYRLTRIKH